MLPAQLRAAEGQVLEIAGEAVEVLALAETAEFHVQRAVEVLLLEPQLGQPPGLPAAPDLLHRADVPGTRVADAVVGKVLAVALGDGELELGSLPAEDLLQIHVHAQGELVGVASGLVVVIAAIEVGRRLADVLQLEVVALLQQLGALAAPVAEHPFRVRGERLGGVRRAPQAQRSKGKQAANGPGGRSGFLVLVHFQRPRGCGLGSTKGFRSSSGDCRSRR